jgi:hypothetical protein
MRERRRRLLRFGLNLAAAVSLVLCVATCVLWVRSYHAVYELGVRRHSWPSQQFLQTRSVTILLVRGICRLQSDASDLDINPKPNGQPTISFPRGSEKFRHEHAAGFHLINRALDLTTPWVRQVFSTPVPYGIHENKTSLLHGLQRFSDRSLAFPAWLAVVVLLVLPTWIARLWLRRRWRARAGHCLTCGYDLRATPEGGGALLNRCPECGTEVTAENAKLAKDAKIAKEIKTGIA